MNPLFLSIKHESLQAKIFNSIMQREQQRIDAIRSYELNDTEKAVKPVSGVFYDKFIQVDDNDLKYGLRNARTVQL